MLHRAESGDVSSRSFVDLFGTCSGDRVTPQASVGNKQSLLPFLLDLDPTCFQIVSPLHVHLSEQDQAALPAFNGKPREASPGAFIG